MMDYFAIRVPLLIHMHTAAERADHAGNMQVHTHPGPKRSIMYLHAAFRVFSYLSSSLKNEDKVMLAQENAHLRASGY